MKNLRAGRRWFGFFLSATFGLSLGACDSTLSSSDSIKVRNQGPKTPPPSGSPSPGTSSSTPSSSPTVTSTNTPSYSTSTVAGVVPFEFDGTGKWARFGEIGPIAVDLSGNIIIADRLLGRLRKVSSDGSVSTFAGPSGGSLSTSLGSCSSGFDWGIGFADGPVQSAKFNNPGAMVFDSTGNLFLVDSGNNFVRKITPDGQVSTLSGQEGKWSYLAFSECRDVKYHYGGIAIDSDSTLLVSDSGNGKVRRLSQSGALSEVVSGLSSPQGLVRTPQGRVFVVEAGKKRILELQPSGTASVLAGGAPTAADGAGTSAGFSNLSGAIVLEASGSLLVADWSAVRRVSLAGEVTTIAGDPTRSGYIEQKDGPTGTATFANTSGLAIDAAGSIFVGSRSESSSDWYLRRIKQGNVSTIAGSPFGAGYANGVGKEARFNNPMGLVLDKLGAIYVAESGRIRKVLSDGTVSTVAGNGGVGPDTLYSARALAFDSQGTLFAADSNGGIIWRVGSDGSLTALTKGVGGTNEIGLAFANGNLLVSPGLKHVSLSGVVTSGVQVAGQHLAVGMDGGVFIGDSATHRISRIGEDGQPRQVPSPEFQSGPGPIASDGQGNLLVIDGARILRVFPDGSSELIAGVEARFSAPQGIAVATGGSIYVSDTGNNAIRLIRRN